MPAAARAAVRAARAPGPEAAAVTTVALECPAASAAIVVAAIAGVAAAAAAGPDPTAWAPPGHERSATAAGPAGSGPPRRGRSARQPATAPWARPQAAP